MSRLKSDRFSSKPRGGGIQGNLGRVGASLESRPFVVVPHILSRNQKSFSHNSRDKKENLGGDTESAEYSETPQ